jgi:hypothetical protein
MANIKVSDLQINGFDLFSDSESYLQELSHEARIDKVVGGTSPTWTVVTITLLLRSDTQQE